MDHLRHVPEYNKHIPITNPPFLSEAIRVNQISSITRHISSAQHIARYNLLDSRSALVSCCLYRSVSKRIS